MTLRNQVLVWVGFSVVTILLLWVFRPILLPFVLGITLAYLLNPLVVLLQRLRIARPWASALILLLFLGLVAGLILMIMPLVIEQVGGLISRMPEYFGSLQELATQLTPQFTEWLGPERAAQLQTSLSQLLGSGVEFIGGLTAQLAANGLTVLSTVAILIIAPVVAFYLLLDWEGMVKGIDQLLPREHRREIRTILDQIDLAMAGVIRGQGSVILVLCIYYTTALTLVGLNFGLVIGLLTGLLSFIPFVGFLTGFTLSMGIALVQFAPHWGFVVLVGVVYAIGQFMEGNILYPKLVGQSININPVWLMFALFAFALLFGFVGLLLAVPLSAITAVLIRYAVKRYRESSLYLGTAAAHRPPDGSLAEPERPLELATASPGKPTRRRPATKK